MNTAIKFVIRPYEPLRDEPEVFRLWQLTLGHSWPLSYETFHSVTVGNAAYQQGDHFVAQLDHEIVGFIGFQRRRIQGNLPLRGHLIVILVAPAYQKRGLGRALHDHALADLKQRGVDDVQIGAGFHYFWQGVPTNLPGAWSFFQACGWKESQRTYDLARDLKDYATPPGVYERIRRPTITITMATLADATGILEFEGRHFPNWFPHYQRVVEQNGYSDVVVAKDAYEGIVGTTFVIHPRAAWWQHDIRWMQLLGESTGGIGPLGVAEPMRENGIGLALAARVTEVLHERKIEKSYIGWTSLVDWYGKLGYQIWQEYVMSWKKL